MFSRISYALRETWANLRRNLTLTIAALLTIAVSLTLVGVWLLAQKAVANTTQRWKGDVEFIVFMKPDAAQEQIDAVGRDLRDNSQVHAEKLRFFDKQMAYDEFKRLYPDTPGAGEHAHAGHDADELPRRAPHRRLERDRRHRRAVPEEGGRAGRRVRQAVGGVDLHRVELPAVGVPRRRPGAAARIADPDLEHDPHGHVRPPPRDRGDEAGRAPPTGSSASRS